MYKRVLVPLDGSQAAEITMPYAEEIVARFRAELVLMTVSESRQSDIEHAYRGYLENTMERVKRELETMQVDKPQIQIQTPFGNPAEEIISYVENRDIHLIVMASHGRSGPGPWLLGSIAGKVLRATRKPVLLIRMPAKPGALAKRGLIKRILIPLDGSEMAESVIPHVLALAHTLGAEVNLLQVIEPLEKLSGYRISESSAWLAQVMEESKTAAYVYLKGMKTLLDEHGLRTSVVVNLGTAADQILDYAETNAVDLIAMSTHGRSGIGRWVFGSTTDKVVHAGDLPILIVRPGKP